MPAPQASSHRVAPFDPDGPQAAVSQQVSRLIDLGLLFSCLASIAIFAGILMSPALAGVRRTYMELDTSGRLLCASTFMLGLLLLMLSLFWAFVHAGLAWRKRGQRERLDQQARAGLASSLARAQQDAARQSQNLITDLRQGGASEQELAQVRALIESVSRKVALQGQRQLAAYENNPAELALDVKATAERLERGEVLEGGFGRAA